MRAGVLIRVLIGLLAYGLTGPGHAQTDPADGDDAYLVDVEATYGPTHPNVAAALIGLANRLTAQGRFRSAEPLYRRSVAIYEARLGPDHPFLAIALAGLAGVLRETGRYEQAKAEYERSLAIRERRLGSDHPDVAASLTNLALTDQALGRYSSAEPLFRRGLAIRERSFGADHPEVATSLNNLALLYQAQGQHARAEPLFRRSLTVRERWFGADHPDVATSLASLATLYHAQRRHAAAEPLFQRSLAIYEAANGPDHPSVATALNNLAAHHRARGRHDAAEPLYRRSLAIYEATLGPDHPSVASGLNNLAALFRAQGNYEPAEPLYRRSLAIFERTLGPDHPAVASALTNLAALYVSLKRPDAAEPLFRRSLDIRERTLGDTHPSVANTLNFLAGLYQNQRRFPEALAFSRRAADILAGRFADRSADQGSDVGEQQSYRAYFLRRIALTYTVGAGSPEQRESLAIEGFETAQWAQASSTSQSVAGMAARFAAGGDRLAAVVRERQDLGARLKRLDATVIAAASKPAIDRDRASEDRLRAELAAEGARIEALDRRIAAEFPAYAELTNPSPQPLTAIQALLAPDEVLLVYLTGPTQTWLWAVRHDRMEQYRLGIRARELAAEVAGLRSRLDPAQNCRFAPFEATRAYALHQRVLAPAAPLLEGARQVFIVPDGALESLPIGVLVTRPPTDDPESPADHREIAWFARDRAITVLPSVGALRALRQFTNAARARSPFFGIGNPKLEGPAGAVRGVAVAGLFRGALADVDAVRQLDPLPETADELRSVARMMGSDEGDLLLGERASEPELQATALDQYRVLHFATHGLTSGELRGLAEPALVLTPPSVATADNDGLLTASKVARLKLNADWVVLSACNTAAAEGGGETGGLSGLAKSFFYAGARSLLVSHWSVPSAATVALVTGAFEALRLDPAIGRAEALRRAQMAMLDPASPPEFAHPMAWAAFVLAGEGGPGR